jgi:hypothetical protein
MRALALVFGLIVLHVGAAQAADMYLHCVVSHYLRQPGYPEDFRIDLARSTAQFLGGATMRANIGENFINNPYPDGLGWRIIRRNGLFDLQIDRSLRSLHGTCAKLERGKF